MSAPPYVFGMFGCRNSVSADINFTCNLYHIACFTTVGFAFSADRRQERGLHLVVAASIGMIGYILLITLKEQAPAARFVAATLACCGVFPLIPLSSVWNSNNVGGHTKRGVAIAFVTGVGNAGGIISGQMYRVTDAPYYVTGHAISLGMMGLTILTALTLRTYLYFENRRRDRLSPEQHRIACEGEELCDKHPDFRYIL